MRPNCFDDGHARHPLRHQNPGRAVAGRPGGNRSDHPKEIFPVAKRAKTPPGICLPLGASCGYDSPIGSLIGAHPGKKEIFLQPP